MLGKSQHTYCSGLLGDRADQVDTIDYSEDGLKMACHSAMI